MTARELAERAVVDVLTTQPSLESIRRLAALVAVAGEQLQVEVRHSRARGESWDSIAAAVRGRYPSGGVAALGDLVPGGTSTTTVRRFYGDRGAS